MKMLANLKKLFSSKINVEFNENASEALIVPNEVEFVAETKINADWLIIGCSVIGNSHITNNIPCQDSHFTDRLSDKWSIAVVSDGAGSHKNSHHGSAFMVKNIVEVLKDLFANESWFNEEIFPSNKEWRNVSIKAFSLVFENLKKFGFENEMPLKSLGGTLNLLVFSDEGFLSAHIGDGRAAVQFEDRQWDSAITPFKGEQAGETVFLTTDYTWEEPSLCIETRAVQNSLKSFALLSDGLENYCFYCNVKIENEEKFCDPNLPYETFFNQNIECVLNMFKNGESKEQIEEKFSKYLKEGHPLISKESDDKTLILGIKI